MNFDKEPCVSRDNPGKTHFAIRRQFENSFCAVVISFCPCHYCDLGSISLDNKGGCHSSLYQNKVTYDTLSDTTV